MPISCPAEFIAFAGRLADAAGDAIRPHFRTKIAVDTKTDASPVTIADRNAEAAMRALIERAYPTHGIWGEEFGIVRKDAEFVWVLDPIDGTKAFISGLPIFGTLVALMHGGKPILGIIDQPVARERWLGAAGIASTFNGQACRTRACPRVADAALINAQNGLSGAASVGSLQHGFYVEAGYDLLNPHPKGQWAVVPYLRFEKLDTQAEVPPGFLREPALERRVLSAGVSVKPVTNIALKVDYQWSTNRAQTGVGQLNLGLGFLF